LGGQVDALVFAGGIGEHAPILRARVVERCACLGFEIEATRNQGDIKAVVEEVGATNVLPRVLVCRTDEQAEMARAYM
jgi:acetate kinase